MNVDDVPETENIEGNLLNLIFERQAELMDKYHDIEQNSGLMQTEKVPVDLDDRFGQARLKDLAWRTVEEVAESLEAYDFDHMTHAQEEVADALHFFIELCILSGFDNDTYFMTKINLAPSEEALKVSFDLTEAKDVYTSSSIFLRDLGCAMNCLKNKPWKQTHMLTDKVRYHSNILNAFFKLISYAKSMGLTHTTLFDLYFRKSEVNKFRQRSQY